MKAAKDKVVTIDYTIADAQGNILENEMEPFAYLHGDYDNIFSKIENALEGQGIGYEAYVQLEPHEAFGDYDPELVRLEDRNKFPEPVEVGMQFEGLPESADDGLDDLDEADTVIYVVTDLTPDKVVVDGNHPFAGLALQFRAKILDIRDATLDEIAQGHPYEEDDDFGFTVGDASQKPILH